MLEREIEDALDEELDEELEPTETDELEEEGETPESEESDEAADADDSDDEDAELVVTIGDEKPEAEEVPASAPQWVKDLRKENRELKKKLKTVSTAPADEQRKELGPKPKLADYDYDEGKLETALDAWYEAKREAETAERNAKDAQTAQQREWDAQLQKHVKCKGALKVKDYDEAEERVFEELDATQQGIIISGAENSALVVLALARNAKALKELSAIKDPVKYAFAIAKLETKLKTTKRRPASAPEGTVDRGNTGAARTSEATLQKLRAQAEKTGDYSKVHEYRRKLRQRA